MRKKALRMAAENPYGFIDATPGTDMARRFIGIASESTIKKYLRLGYLKKVGSGLVLTKAGYKAL